MYWFYPKFKNRHLEHLVVGMFYKQLQLGTIWFLLIGTTEIIRKCFLMNVKKFVKVKMKKIMNIF